MTTDSVQHTTAGMELEAEHAAGGHDGIYVEHCTTCPVFNMALHMPESQHSPREHHTGGGSGSSGNMWAPCGCGCHS